MAEDEGAPVRFRFETEVIHWRGPSPYFYAPVPAAEAGELRALMRAVSYGWGMIPVTARLAEVEWTTSLFPKDGTYLLPLKDKVRRATGVTAGDRVEVELSVDAMRRA
jgi:hypothetical protein